MRQRIANVKRQERTVETITRKCRQCRCDLPIQMFGWQNRTKNILRATCRECDAAMIELFGIEDEYESRRATRLFLKYGITPDDEAALLKQQNGACAACGKKPEGKRLTVDYCEESGAVRGMLCPKCFKAVGWVGEDLAQMRRTMAYLLASHLRHSA